MPLSEFTPPPGIVNDGTAYSAKGSWYDCDKVRFRGNFPERIGGWTPLTSNQFAGTCRQLVQWTDLSLINHIGVGTNLKYYIENSTGVLNDITPQRSTGTLGANPFTTTLGSAIVTVVHTAHGAIQNDYVQFGGATAVGGVTPNGWYQILTIIDVNTYTINVGSNATSGATGGGSAVTFAYQINTGSADYSSGSGWGSGGWSSGGWGRSAANPNTVPMRLWSGANFGGDLVINPRGGGVYYYSTATPPANGAVNLSTLSGAAQTPLMANFVCVMPDAQRVMAFGCNPYGTTTQDPLTFRWSTDGSAANWTIDNTTTAGELRIPVGSAIMTAAKARGRTLIWTESSLYALTLVDTFVYGLQLISASIDLVSPNAVASVDEMIMWMGRENFMSYSGTVSTVPCSVREFVFSNINLGQAWKIHATTNRTFREIWWFYPSAQSHEVDRYVVYNYAENVWYYGTLPRTAWSDAGILNNPIAASTDGYIYNQESGLDDGSTIPASPINSYIKSGPIQLAAGHQFSFVNRIVPDVTFAQSASTAPAVNYSLTAQNYPGATPNTSDGTGGSVAKVASSPVEEFTTKVDCRLRGRQFELQIGSNQAGVFWRLGTQRFDVRPDGRR